MSVDASAVNVAKYIIKKTPIGHLGKGLENLKIVLGERVMDTDDVKKEIHNYGENHLSSVQNDVTNSKVVVSALTKDNDGFYYDQGQKVRFKIGLENGTIENAETIDFQNDLRDQVQAKLLQYLDKYFKAEVTKFNVFLNEGANKLVVIISVHNLNLKAFWTGEWLSTWELNLSDKSVHGVLKANTYYYEEGNVQLHIDNKFDSKISGDIPTALIEFIEKSENDVQTAMEKVYDDFNEIYIKPLRRALPVTGTKMNWNLNQIQMSTNQ